MDQVFHPHLVLIEYHKLIKLKIRVFHCAWHLFQIRILDQFSSVKEETFRRANSQL